MGELVADIVVRPVPNMADLPDSTLVKEINAVNGGDALNTAVNIAKLGGKVTFIGRAGRDLFGQHIVGIAKEAGVDMSHIRYSEDQQTAKVVALIQAGGARKFLHYPGANQQFCLGDISLEVMKTCSHFHIGGTFHLPGFDGADAAKMLKMARELGLTTSMDVAYDHSGRWMETIRCCMPYLDYFMPSTGEAEHLLHEKEPSAMAGVLKELGVRNVIIKMGENGVYCSDAAGHAFTCGCYHVDAIDTTGAGDAFVGGFIHGLDDGLAIEDCVIRGTANAAFAVQQVGATTGIPPLDELQAFIKNSERPKVSYE